MIDNISIIEACHSNALQQDTFFRQKIEEVEKNTNTNRIEMQQWYQQGYLSFNPVELSEFDDRHIVEIAFLASILKSGLTESLIKQILEDLPKPYCYDPDRMFYSFYSKEWVTVPPIEDIINLYLNDLAENGENELLNELSDRVKELLDNAPTEDDEIE